MKLFWSNNQNNLLIVTAGAVLAADIFLFLINDKLSLKLFPIIISLLLALIMIAWDIKVITKIKILLVLIVFGYLFGLLTNSFTDLGWRISYGSITGLKLFSIPITISILWFVVTLSSWHIVNFGKLDIFKKIVIAVALAIIYNLLMQQFAISNSVWNINTSIFPISYYLFWGLYSLSALLFINWMSKNGKPNIFIASILPMLSIYFWLLLVI